MGSAATSTVVAKTGDWEKVLTIDIGAGQRRFETLLRGDLAHEADNHDQVLLTRKDWIVAPTLGAIVPNWLLLIPRDPVLNFRDFSKLRGRSAEQLLYEVRQHLGLRNDEIIWFEHGPRIGGTFIGCGLDHAHVHILVRPSFSFTAFTDKARTISELEWVSGPSGEAHDRLACNRSYLIAGSGDTSIIAQDVETIGSQFFRRVVGLLVEAGEVWDYRRHAHADHVAETIRTFRSLSSIARHGE